jgi:hypothetical protein
MKGAYPFAQPPFLTFKYWVVLPLFLFSGLILQGQSQFEPSNAFLTPDVVEVEPAEIFSISLEIEPSQDGFTAAQIGLSYDPAVIQIVTASFDPSSPLSFIVAPATWDNVEGKIFAASLGFSPVTEPFTYLNIQFTAVADGTTQIEHVFTGTQTTLLALNGSDVTGSTPPATITVGEPFDCPDLQANIGDECDDGQANTENDVVNSECECVGNFVCAPPFPAVDEGSISTVVQAFKAILSWDPVPNQIGCQVQVRREGAPGILGSAIKIGATASTQQVPFSLLNPGQTYEWRVRCGCSQTPLVAGPFTLWYPFTTPAGIQMNASPNPTENESTVTFTSTVNQQVELEVFDITGKQVVNLFSGMANAEETYQFRFDASDLPNGIYLYRLSTGSEVVTKKVIVAH